jgi:hypothetical protein
MNSPNPPTDTMTANRHATTLAEIQQMTEDYRKMQMELATCYRENDAKMNKIELLETALMESRNGEKIYRRKLIRLAAAMEMIGRLSSEAEAIMKSAREIDEIETEKEARSEDA